MNSASDRAVPGAAAIADVAGVTDVEVGDDGHVLVADSDPGCGTARVRLFSPAGVASPVAGDCAAPLPHAPRLVMEGEHFALGFSGTMLRGSIGSSNLSEVALPSEVADTRYAFSIDAAGEVWFPLPDGLERAPVTGAPERLLFGTNLAWPWGPGTAEIPSGAGSLPGSAIVGEVRKSGGYFLVLWPVGSASAGAAVRGNQSVSLSGLPGTSQATLSGLSTGAWHARRGLVAFARTALALLLPSTAVLADAGATPDAVVATDAGVGGPDAVAIDSEPAPDAGLASEFAMEWLSATPTEPSSEGVVVGLVSVSSRAEAVVPGGARLRVEVSEPTLCRLRGIQVWDCPAFCGWEEKASCPPDEACGSQLEIPYPEAFFSPYEGQFQVTFAASPDRRDFEATTCSVGVALVDAQGGQLASVAGSSTFLGPKIELRAPARFSLSPSRAGVLEPSVTVVNSGKAAWLHEIHLAAAPRCEIGGLGLADDSFRGPTMRAGSTWEVPEFLLRGAAAARMRCHVYLTLDPADDLFGARPDSSNFRPKFADVPVDLCVPFRAARLERLYDPRIWRVVLDVERAPNGQPWFEEELEVSGPDLERVGGRLPNSEGVFTTTATTSFEVVAKSETFDELSVTVRSASQCPLTVTVPNLELTLDITPAVLEPRPETDRWKPQILALGVTNRSLKTFAILDQPEFVPGADVEVAPFSILGDSALPEVAPQSSAELRMPVEVHGSSGGSVEVLLRGRLRGDGESPEHPELTLRGQWFVSHITAACFDPPMVDVERSSSMALPGLLLAMGLVRRRLRRRLAER